MAIDIKGLDLGAVVAALHNNTRPLGMGFLHATGDMTPEDGRALLAETRRWNDGAYSLDYVRGRPLKVTLYEDRLEGERLYDRDSGPGQCEAVIARLRAEIRSGPGLARERFSEVLASLEQPPLEEQ